MKFNLSLINHNMLFPTFRIPSRRAAGWEARFRHVQKTEISKVIVIPVGFKNVLGFAAHTPSKLEKLFPALKHLQICIWFLKKKKKIFFSSRLSSMQPEFDGYF